MTDTSWRKLAPYYPWMRNNPFSVSFLKREQAAARGLLTRLKDTPIDVAVDLGSGSGHSLSLIPERTQITIAVDNCPEMIAVCRSRYGYILYLQADACQLPIKSDSLDLVFCIGLLEYIADVPLLLSEIHRILKKKRWLILSNAPPGPLNALRRLLGPRLYLRRPAEIEKLINTQKFRIKNQSKTSLQRQYLLQKH